LATGRASPGNKSGVTSNSASEDIALGRVGGGSVLSNYRSGGLGFVITPFFRLDFLCLRLDNKQKLLVSNGDGRYARGPAVPVAVML
jgi:hypothetical protein